jgi:hypothetical protein
MQPKEVNPPHWSKIGILVHYRDWPGEGSEKTRRERVVPSCAAPSPRPAGKARPPWAAQCVPCVRAKTARLNVLLGV